MAAVHVCGMTTRHPTRNEIVRLAFPSDHWLCYYYHDFRDSRFERRERLHRVLSFTPADRMVRLESIDRSKTVRIGVENIVRLSPLELLALQAEGAPGKYVP